MRRYDHWTPRYVLDRSRNILTNLLHPNWPWLTPKAVELLKHRLGPMDAVFEWGAGRSTLWLARRVSQVASVEHDPRWFERVQLRAGLQGLTNLSLKLVKHAECPSGTSRYVNPIYEFDAALDVILVDGLHRQHCALAAVTRIRPGGMLIVDNANWYLPSRSRSPASRRPEQGPASSEWAEFERHVARWPTAWTSNGVTDTAIWFAPSRPVT
jgi:predicted O-methyltransferase YrrM